MYCNSSCSLFIKSLGYKKVFIPHCFFSRKKQSAYDNKGLNYNESAFVIFKTNNIDFTDGEDFVIEGQCDLEVYADSPEKYSQCIRAIKESGAYTIMSANVLNYGSGNMRHVELSCR